MRSLCKCGQPHDDWPSEDGRVLCQMCWERECSESWWRMVVAIDGLQHERDNDGTTVRMD